MQSLTGVTELRMGPIVVGGLKQLGGCQFGYTRPRMRVADL
jgi:hypothetical protein